MANSIPIPTHKRFKDLTGQKFARWRVDGYDGYRGGHHFWSCTCECGTVRVVNSGSLRKGASRSCGCLKNEELAERRFIDLTGMRFGRLVVTCRLKSTSNRTMWLCRCDCGASAKVDGGNLKAGLSLSCGCYNRDQLSERQSTHRMSKSPEWQAWVSLRQRCNNPNCREYPYYGGRGITVYPDWDASFESFYRDMGPRPSDKHSIDRYPNNNGPYAPWNCRWATKSQQAYNRRPKSR